MPLGSVAPSCGMWPRLISSSQQQALHSGRTLPIDAQASAVTPAVAGKVTRGTPLRAAAREPMPTEHRAISLLDYKRFHGMLVGPVVAQRCIESINGHIVFMPSSYGRDAKTFPLEGWSPWESRSLNTVAYYLLVLASFTGLSTLLGTTDIIDARERSGKEGLVSAPILQSSVHPSLEVDQCVLDYLTQPLVGQLDARASSVRLERRFEFHFRLPLLRVVMWHFVSMAPDGQPALDAHGREILHLVEVYEAGVR